MRFRLQLAALVLVIRAVPMAAQQRYESEIRQLEAFIERMGNRAAAAVLRELGK